jgi:protein ImuA
VPSFSPYQALLRDQSPDQGADFYSFYQSSFASPLIEIAPDGHADGMSAFGFALAWMKAAKRDGLMVFTAPDHIFSEYGAPNAEGLAQFGVDPQALLLVRAPNQVQALWAAEQALTLPCAQVLCVIAAAPKPLSLSASRRLFLTAEKSGARGVLLRFDPLAPSAARSRWRVGAAASINPFASQSFGNRELGPPAFDVRLERNRASPAGRRWRVDWNAHEHLFRERASERTDSAANSNEHAAGRALALAASAASVDGQGAAFGRRAV